MSDSPDPLLVAMRDAARRHGAGQVHEEFAAFVNTGNGAHFWRGLMLMHSLGERTLSESVMARFVQMAGAMVEAKTDRAVALAAGLHQELGTRLSPNQRAAQRLRSLKICSALWYRELLRLGVEYRPLDEPPAGPVASESYASIEAQFGIKRPALRTLWSKYKSEKRYEAPDGVAALADVWTNRSVTEKLD